MDKQRLRREALLYHAKPQPGKIAVVPTKKYSSQRDLSLAYSPGVAEPCLEIAKDKNNVYIKDPVQPNQTVYISWTQLSQQKCIIYQGPSPNLQEEIDEFFKNIFHRKKIFFTIENFQKKDLLGKKRLF